MSKDVNTGKRRLTFWKSDTPLTSKRVSQILSNPKDSEKLATAVRNTRHASKTGKKSDYSFKLEPRDNVK